MSARHWRFELDSEPKFNGCAMNYLSFEKVGDSYLCFVNWIKRQKSSAIKSYFGKKTSNIRKTTIYEIQATNNVRKEYGSRVCQGRRTDL